MLGVRKQMTHFPSQLCSILYEHKITKALLKQEGWDIREYQRLAADNNATQFEFERAGFANNELRRSGRASERKSSKKGRKKSNDETIAPTTERKVLKI